MDLVVLGSGTAVPHPLRTSSGYWLQTANGKILLDLSASAFHRMAEENLEWWDIDSIWISHFHLDHCAGIAPFLFATRGAPSTKDRTKPLKFFGAPGLRCLIEHFDGINFSTISKSIINLDSIKPWFNSGQIFFMAD